MIVSRRIVPRKRKRSGFRFLFTFAVTTAMVATGGFGMFPDNPLTQTFNQVIGENFSTEYLQPFNSYMESISAPTIQPKPGSGPGDSSLPDPAGLLADLFAPPTMTGTALVSPTAEFTETAVTSTLITLSPVPTSTSTITPTTTRTGTATVAPLVFFATRTFTPKPSSPQTTLTYYPPNFTSTPLGTTTETETPTPTSTETATMTATSTSTPTPTLPTGIVLYSGGLSIGSIGNRAAADAFCPGSLPTGYANSHAFIGITSADSIANLPGNYGIPTGVPIQSQSGNIIAMNWSDLMDGTILMSLDSAGIVSQSWWSGAENASGSHIDSVTPDCSEWTSNAITDGGNYGEPWLTDGTWVDNGSAAACDQMLAVLCIGY